MATIGEMSSIPPIGGMKRRNSPRYGSHNFAKTLSMSAKSPRLTGIHDKITYTKMMNV